MSREKRRSGERREIVGHIARRRANEDEGEKYVQAEKNDHQSPIEIGGQESQPLSKVLLLLGLFLNFCMPELLYDSLHTSSCSLAPKPSE